MVVCGRRVALSVSLWLFLCVELVIIYKYTLSVSITNHLKWLRTVSDSSILPLVGGDGKKFEWQMVVENDFRERSRELTAIMDERKVTINDLSPPTIMT